MFEGKIYRGKRTVEHMQKFVLDSMNLNVELISGNKWIDKKYNEKEWLLFLCGENGSICPEKHSILKLAAMLVNYLY